MKKLLSIILICTILLAALPLQALATDASYELTITRDGVVSTTATVTKTTLNNSVTFQGGKSTTTFYVVTLAANESFNLTNGLKDNTGKLLTLNYLYYLTNDKVGFSKNSPSIKWKEEKIEKAHVEKATLESAKVDCFQEGYFYYCFLIDGNLTVGKDANNKNIKEPINYALLVQIKQPPKAEKDKLRTAISAASALDEDNYYTDGDRYNGKVPLQSGGYWSNLQDKLTDARNKEKDETVSQDVVDAATSALNDAIDALISKKNVNATALYESLHADWRWYYNELRLETGTPVSADNCTALTWDAYAQAKIDGQALLDELYDADGNPTGVNTSDRNDEVKAAATAIDAHKLVNMDAYNSAYEAYQSGKAEAEALIEQYDPEKLTAKNYSAESWKAFTDAHAALKADLDYRIVGGSTEAYAMLKDFTQHVEALKNTRKQLVSDKDITISFTYLNNFSAQFENFRKNGTNLYVNAELELTKGTATLADAIKAAGLVLDRHNDNMLPGGSHNASDTLPWFMLFVNGNSYGLLQEALLNNYQVVQLHDSDVVRLVRICQPLQMQESSDGTDSTKIELDKTFIDEQYRDSIATINMTSPATSKVGAKTAVSATVTGANVTNAGKTLNPKDVTLFVSDPTEEKTLSQPIYQTTATTDESGNLQYVFRESGYYTVAMYNVSPDDYGTQTVYGKITAGEYHSLYAGDYALIYVAEADDPAAIMTQYRAENLAQAKAYYEQFHDYDFTAENYKALKSAYETLKSHLQSAATFKELMDQFDKDFAALQTAGAKAIDHAAVISALRENLSYLPEDLNELTASDRELLQEIQTVYNSVRTNAYEKTLLTNKETNRLDEIASINLDELAVTHKVNLALEADEASFPYNPNDDRGNPYYGLPNIKWVMTPLPNGVVPDPKDWGGEGIGNSLPETANAGQYVFIRYYLTTTDAKYWLVWSIDGGKTWLRAESQTLVTPNDEKLAYPGYYLVKYLIPKTAEEGSTITFKLEMVSKEDYQKMFETLDEKTIAKLRNAAIAVVEAAFNACKQSEYDAAGIKALTDAMNSGEDNINAAETETAIKTARDNAVAAIKAVPKAKSSIVSTDKTQYNSGKTVGSVTVIVENTTWTDDDVNNKPPITGTLVSGEYALGENDSMMTMILQALELGGYTWNDIKTVTSDSYKTTYIASIDQGEKSLAEKDGAAGAGWMGTLNDWMVNQGYAAFTVKNGSLKSGDVIHVMYTMDLGEDLGSSWTNNETTLSSLTFSGSELTPAFSGATTDYLLVIPDKQIGTRIDYSAANKNFQTRAYLNTYGSDNAYYANGDIMAVSSGDVIYVGVGDKSWPTMNKASNYTTTRYTITVVQKGSVSDVEKLINNLPSPGKITLANAADVRTAKAQFDLLNNAQQAKISGALKDKLKKCNDVITNLEAAKLVSDAIAALPDVPGTDDIGAIRSAEEAYNKLTDEQKDYLTQREVNKLNSAVSAVSTLEVGYVTGLIAQLPAKDAVTAQDRARIDAARTAYNNLTKAQKKQVSNYKRLTDAEEAFEELGKTAFYEDALNKVLAYVQKEAPNPSYNGDSNGTEWAVMSVARGNVNATVWYDTYLNNTAAAVAARNGKLDTTSSQRKHTEYERIILALTALGEDATKFKGSNGTVYDLVAPLFDKTASGTYRVSEQGNNGTVFALIALDSGSYYKDATGNAAREAWIETLCDNQFKGKVKDGGGAWNIDGDHPGASVDTTAMAVQALAPYYSTNTTVKAVVDKALEWLSYEYQTTGDYGSSEAAAQVIVALSAMKIDAKTDARFQYNGVSVLSNFLSYADETTGGFLHVKVDPVSGKKATANQMASEQAAYTLVAYDRYVKGSNRLYDMSDATKRANATVQEVIDLINRIGTVGEGSYNAIAEARIAYDKLSAEDQAKVTNYGTLTAAEDAYKTILRKKQTDQYTALKLHYDELLNNKNKKYSTAAKKKLANILQQAQTDMNAAKSCERVMDVYTKAIADLDAVKPGDIEVTFRLIGALEATQDVDLTNDSYLPEYVTWVPTTTYALQEDATVYDLFTEAMSDAGLRYIGAESNYVSTIYAPSCMGSYALSEFSNGKRSGWMYTVNGSHPNQGLKYWTLKDGDVVVWHYINDYSHEVADWFNDPKYPSLGNGTYYNDWLRAADIAPEQYVQQLIGKILTVGKHGTVEPTLTFQHIGKSVTFTFKPDTGYKVKDVKVNGKSVGAVTSYTVDKLTVSTRIEVEFTDGKMPFTDVHETDWFYNDVLFVYEEGLFAGTSDTTFSPNAAMTRAMLVTVLYRLEGEPTVYGRSGFSDVQYNSYYEDAVTWAADNNIVNGTSTTTFSPNANVTREQMAAILYRYAQYKKYNTATSSSLNGFTDYATVSSYAVTPMQWSVAEKLVNGSVGKLMPTGNATRAQVAAILHRFVENVATTK